MVTGVGCSHDERWLALQRENCGFCMDQSTKSMRTYLAEKGRAKRKRWGSVSSSKTESVEQLTGSLPKRRRTKFHLRPPPDSPAGFDLRNCGEEVTMSAIAHRQDVTLGNILGAPSAMAESQDVNVDLDGDHAAMMINPQEGSVELRKAKIRAAIAADSDSDDSYADTPPLATPSPERECNCRDCNGMLQPPQPFDTLVVRRIGYLSDRCQSELIQMWKEEASQFWRRYIEQALSEDHGVSIDDICEIDWVISYSLSKPSIAARNSARSVTH